MQNNHIYVEDNGKGHVVVFDDNERIKPERKWAYGSSTLSRSGARQQAESFAAQQAAKLKCGWGCNYEGRKV